MLTKLSNTPEADFNVFSLDSEDNEGFTYVWCVYGLMADGREVEKTFYKAKDVIDFLFRTRHRHSILTGVNLLYDLNTLRYRGGYNWDEIINMGKLITAQPKEKEYKKYFSCQHNNFIKMIELGNFILGTSLKGMANMFKIEGHIDRHVLYKDGTKEQMAEACMSHAKTGVLVFKELEKQLHAIGAHIKLTGSATAIDFYRRGFLTSENEIYDCIKETGGMLDPWRKGGEADSEARLHKMEYIKTIGKACYVGGRCENFDLGLFTNQVYLDINSSYPYQMHERIFPNINSYRRRQGDKDTLISYMQEYEGEAHIIIKTPKKMRIPFLHTKRDDGKLIFPLGTFQGWYTFPEIRKALSIGYKIKDVLEIAVFDGVKSPFIGYVDEMMKLKVVPATKQAAKLLMNGLSGKFGQLKPTESGWRQVNEGEELAEEDIFLLKTSADSEELQQWTRDSITEDSEASDFAETSYPLIVAYITAWGRIQEYEAMENIGFEHVHYMDTDSIIADKEAVDKAVRAGRIIIDSKKLGAYDLEHEQITVEIRGLKYYRLQEENIFQTLFPEWVYHIKGVPDVNNVEYWENRGCYVNSVVKLKTALRTGQRVNTFKLVYRQDRVERNNKRIFEPEQTGKSNYNSLPFIIGA